jgi:hypothetical protein
MAQGTRLFQLTREEIMKRILLILMLLVPVFFLASSCQKRKLPSSPAVATITPTITCTSTDEGTTTHTGTETPSSTPTATMTSTALPGWAIKNFATPITGASNASASRFFTNAYIFAGYASGAGPGKTVSVLKYTDGSGWTETGNNIDTSYSFGRPWTTTGELYTYAATTDISGNIYVWYLPASGTGSWSLVGGGIAAGPNCSQPSIAASYVNPGIEIIYMAYIDGNDNNTVKVKNASHNGSFSGWGYCGINNPPGAVNKANIIDETGAISLGSYVQGFTSQYVEFIFSDANLNSGTAVRAYGGQFDQLVYTQFNTISTGITSWNYAFNSYSQGKMAGFVDSGEGGRAIVKKYTASSAGWLMLGGGALSDGQAAWLALASNFTGGYLYAAYADVPSGNRLVVKRTSYSGAWEDVQAPNDPVTSCAVGYVNSYPYVLYTCDSSNNNELKLYLMQY